jgi:acetyl esterase/lipase
LKWTFASANSLGIDTSRVSVGGPSAGGHLAAVAALMARDDPEMPPLVLQLLVVPVVDVRYIPVEGSCDPDECPYKSYISLEYAPCLPLNRMRWFSNLWIGTDPGEK